MPRLSSKPELSLETSSCFSKNCLRINFKKWDPESDVGTLNFPDVTASIKGYIISTCKQDEQCPEQDNKQCAEHFKQQCSEKVVSDSVYTRKYSLFSMPMKAFKHFVKTPKPVILYIFFLDDAKEGKFLMHVVWDFHPLILE